MTLFIGLGHYSNVGKDTFANALADVAWDDHNISASIDHFADKLKAICRDLYGWAGLKNALYYEEHREKRDEIIPALGKTPVEIWVDFGTKAIRNHVYDMTWVQYLLHENVGWDVVIIPDVRFPNEAEAIHEKGGMVIRILRPGVEPRNTIADRALLAYNGWDMTITAETVEELRAEAKKLAAKIDAQLEAQ